MFKKINIKAIRDSIALLMIAAVVGTIVSFVAQIFMIGAKNIYNFIFNNKDFIFNIDIGNTSLNLVPLIIFMPSSILLALLIYNLKNLDGLVIKIKIYAECHQTGKFDYKDNLGGLNDKSCTFSW